MLGKPSNERALYVAVVAMIALAVGVVFMVRRGNESEVPSTNTSSRLTYAALYDGLWRQDDGRGSLLVTATLFIPPMTAALGEDDQRSDVETQLWMATKNVTERQVAIYLTLDSVNGFVADRDIEQALSIIAEPNLKMTQVSWKPIIGNQTGVNANIPVSSQRGIAIFTVESTVDWSRLERVTLVANNLGDQPKRQFVWNQINTLMLSN